MSQFHFDPETYMDLMRTEVPLYGSVQDTIAGAAGEIVATEILDLGSGTGETLARVIEHHPAAHAIGLDENDAMLGVARTRLAGRNVEFQVADLLDPLPSGPFDLVVSALAIHHLDGAGKAELFRRIAAVLQPGGRFVLGDVVIPEDGGATVIPLSDDYDKPSTLTEQLEWLEAAGFLVEVLWRADDLAVLTADRPG